MRLTEATWGEVESSARRVLVVPLGSLEQHGPHLPLDVDARVALAVAERVVVQLPGAALAPLLPVGASGEHAHFPGTLSIGTEALAALLVELVRSASDTWPLVLVVNGHGGNVAALRHAVRTSVHDGRRLLVHTVTWQGDAHAGRSETSLVLALAPHLVRLERAEAGSTQPLHALLPRLVAGGVRAVSPNGVLGDPAGASASEGRRVLADNVAAAVRLLEGEGAVHPGRAVSP